MHSILQAQGVSVQQPNTAQSTQTGTSNTDSSSRSSLAFNFPPRSPASSSASASAAAIAPTNSSSGIQATTATAAAAPSSNTTATTPAPIANAPLDAKGTSLTIDDALPQKPFRDYPVALDVYRRLRTYTALRTPDTPELAVHIADDTPSPRMATVTLVSSNESLVPSSQFVADLSLVDSANSALIENHPPVYQSWHAQLLAEAGLPPPHGLPATWAPEPLATALGAAEPTSSYRQHVLHAHSFPFELDSATNIESRICGEFDQIGSKKGDPLPLMRRLAYFWHARRMPFNYYVGAICTMAHYVADASDIVVAAIRQLGLPLTADDICIGCYQKTVMSFGLFITVKFDWNEWQARSLHAPAIPVARRILSPYGLAIRRVCARRSVNSRHC